jgi:hypothetical protein
MSLVESLEAIKRIKSDLFAIEIDGVEVIFTLPSFKKVDQYAKLLELATGDDTLQNVLYDHIFTTYVEDKFLANHSDDIPAGIPSTIAKLILLMSGADESIIEYTNGILELYRQNINSPINIIKSRICQTYSYKFQDLDSLNYQELLHIYVQAEQEMMRLGIIEEGNELKLIPIEKQQEEQLDISKVIAQDAREFRNFEKKELNQKIQETPEHQAKIQQLEEKYKRIKMGG